MAVASMASKNQQQMNINRPQTTGKMRINYASNTVGKFHSHPKISFD